MARIPQHFIDELISRSDIVSLVESRVALKKAGREYQACCPFHDEKTPSFTVSPGKQFYHCFGCGAHGTVISFIMEYDRLEFREAVEELALAAGMSIPEESRDDGPAEDYRPLYQALEQADRYYRQQLRRNPEAIEYLRGRGISGEIARDYGIGYAPPGWDNLRSQLPRQAAVAAGLLAEREDGHVYDRFRNRITFPIRDSRGRTIAFGGRTLENDPAKYLNSPETALFHKGKQLYGLYEARQRNKNLSRILVVEGYMDVVALAQHGFSECVATLGTATTAEHLQAMFRICDEVIFCFDGDKAGKRAGWRALDQALPTLRGTRRIRFLFLPEGEDPDSLVRGQNGPQGFQDLIEQARPASSVLLAGLTRGENLATAEGRSRVVEKARPFIEKLPPEAFKAELVRELAGISGLPADDLERLFARGGTSSRAGKTSGTAAAVSARHPQNGVKLTPVRRALQLLMNDPKLADNVQDIDAVAKSSHAGAAILGEAIDFFRRNPTYTTAAFLERWRERSEAGALRRLAVDTPRGEADSLAREFRECVARISARDRQARVRERYDQLVYLQQQRSLDEQEYSEYKQLLQQLRS